MFQACCPRWVSRWLPLSRARPVSPARGRDSKHGRHSQQLAHILSWVRAALFPKGIDRHRPPQLSCGYRELGPGQGSKHSHEGWNRLLQAEIASSVARQCVLINEWLGEASLLSGPAQEPVSSGQSKGRPALHRGAGLTAGRAINHAV